MAGQTSLLCVKQSKPQTNEYSLKKQFHLLTIDSAWFEYNLLCRLSILLNRQLIADAKSSKIYSSLVLQALNVVSL